MKPESIHLTPTGITETDAAVKASQTVGNEDHRWTSSSAPTEH
jgi:hypothetical protein